MSIMVSNSSPSQLGNAPGKQSGIALVVALILLVVISLIGLAAVSGTSVQQKITANFYDRQIAFQATEAALRAAEVAITNNPTAATIRDCSSTGGLICSQNPFNETTTTLPAANIQTVPTTTFTSATMAVSPQYVIDLMGSFTLPDPNVKLLSNCFGYSNCAPSQTAKYYRITARSGDPANANVGDRASVTLQSVFRK